VTKQTITVKVGEAFLNKYYGYPAGDFVDIINVERVNFDISLDRIMDNLNELKSKYGKEYTNLAFQEYRDCGCRHDCECSPSYILCGQRLESDLEYEFRIKKEAKLKEAQDERDRIEFERLAKKLGKD
jgi:hypothetical protein